MSFFYTLNSISPNKNKKKNCFLQNTKKSQKKLFRKLQLFDLLFFLFNNLNFSSRFLFPISLLRNELDQY